METLAQYKRDRKINCDVVRKANQLYAEPKTKDTKDARSGFTGTFGDRQIFFGELHQNSWSPMEARNDKLKRAMFREFNECTDARIRHIKTSNYGCHGFKIDLETEWQFAACHISVPETKKYSV